MTMMVRAAAGGGGVLVVGLVRASTSILPHLDLGVCGFLCGEKKVRVQYARYD